MKKTASTAGRKTTTSKQTGKSNAARQSSKRKVQALKAGLDSRIREQTNKKQIKKKTAKRAPAPKVIYDVKGRDSPSPVAAQQHRVPTVDLGTFKAQVNPARAIEQGGSAELVNREELSPMAEKPSSMERDRKVHHDSPANRTHLNGDPERSFVRFPPMEIALAQWQFWAKAIANYQQTCLRLASMSTAQPIFTTRPRQ